jgi:hypothetical protein
VPRRGPRDRTELEAVLQRFHALSLRDQLRFYQETGDYLGAELKPERAVDRAARERAEALEAMREVAEHLRLAANQAPTTDQFRTTASELGLDWTVNKIIRAFGRYSFAQDALLGRWIPDTREQRKVRSATHGRRRSHEEYLTGVRLWLKTRPRQENTGSYDECADDYNDQITADQRRLVRSDGLQVALGLNLAIIVKVARGELTLPEAQQQLVNEQLDGHGDNGLVSSRWIAARLGIAGQGIADLSRPSQVPLARRDRGNAQALARRRRDRLAERIRGSRPKA